MKYRHILHKVDAVEWFKLGDHPKVIAFKCDHYWASAKCDMCGHVYGDHGRLKRTGFKDFICPGSFIISNENVLAAIPPKEFHEQFSPVRASRKSGKKK